MQNITDRLVEEFATKFGVDIIGDNAHEVNFFRQALTEVATAQREADKAVLEGMKIKPGYVLNMREENNPVQVHNAALDQAIEKLV